MTAPKKTVPQLKWLGAYHHDSQMQSLMTSCEICGDQVTFEFDHPPLPTLRCHQAAYYRIPGL
jgi:hypothetical protein